MLHPSFLPPGSNFSPEILNNEMIVQAPVG